MSFWQKREPAKRDCFDPRDRIFAVRRTVGIENITSLRPGYTVSVRDLYQSAVVSCLRSATAANIGEQGAYPHPALILALAGTASDNVDAAAWPSWIPRFHHSSRRSRCKSYVYSTSVQNLWMPDWGKFEVAVDADSDELKLRCRCFGTIQKLLPGSSCPRVYIEDQEDTTSYWSCVTGPLIRWYRWCRFFVSEALGRDDLGFDELKSLLHGVSIRDWDADYPSYETFCRKLRDISGQPLSFAEHKEMWEDINPVLPYALGEDYDHARILSCMTGDKPGSRSVGWIPPEAVPGDLLCIIAGSPFPIVVRQQPAGRYRLLGDAYIHDIAEWQAFGLERDEDWLHHWKVNAAAEAIDEVKLPWPLGITREDLHARLQLAGPDPASIDRAAQVRSLLLPPIMKAWKSWKEEHLGWLALQ